MSNWKPLLNSDPVDWLLERDNPSVRYFTLVDILDRIDNNSEVIETRDQIMEIGPVPKILAKQEEGGYWGRPEDFYIRSKYKGTVWQLLVLAQLGADGNDERVKKACEFIFDYSQDRQSGGFSYLGTRRRGGQHSGVLPCLTGNMVWSLIRLGHLEDPRVQRGIEWITAYQRFDDGVERKPKGWPYDGRDKCWGKHTCHMGVVKGLKALSEIPPNRRSGKVKDTISEAAEYILAHHIYKRSHDLGKLSIPAWLSFGFPLMVNTNVLEILEILSSLGYRDERMQDAVDLVISKQNRLGRWKLEQTYNGRFQVNIEREGESSRWITLNALRVLRRLYS